MLIPTSIDQSYNKVIAVIESCKTKDLTCKDKLKDIELMIEAFVEEERYEDCAFLVKIKEKVIKYEKSLTSGKL